MARWMDADIDLVMPTLAQIWKAAQYSGLGLDGGKAVRGSLEQGSQFANPVPSGRILIEGDIESMWPLLSVWEVMSGRTRCRGGLPSLSVRIPFINLSCQKSGS
jgi:hypothetical protein